MSAPPEGSDSQALANELLLLAEIPVVEDMSHHDDVGRRKRIGKEISRLKRRPVAHSKHRRVLR